MKNILSKDNIKKMKNKLFLYKNSYFTIINSA